MKKILLILFVVLFYSCRKSVTSYLYYYQVETSSPKIMATYRLLDGTYKTERIFGGPVYGWESKSLNDRYDIQVKNDTTFGTIKVRLIRDFDTLITVDNDTLATIKKL